MTEIDDLHCRALGQTIRTLRVIHGIAQRKLASDTGMDRTDVCRVETGKRYPTIPQLRAIAMRLGVKPGQMLDAPAAIESRAKERHSGPSKRRQGRAQLRLLAQDPPDASRGSAEASP